MADASRLVSLSDRFKQALDACDSAALRKDATPIVSELTSWRDGTIPAGASYETPFSMQAKAPLERQCLPAAFYAADPGAPPCCLSSPAVHPPVAGRGALQTPPQQPEKQCAWWLWAVLISLLVAFFFLFLKGKLLSFFSRLRKPKEPKGGALSTSPLVPPPQMHRKREAPPRSETPQADGPCLLPRSLLRSASRPVEVAEISPEVLTQGRTHQRAQGVRTHVPARAVTFQDPEESSGAEEEVDVPSQRMPRNLPPRDPNFEEL